MLCIEISMEKIGQRCDIIIARHDCWPKSRFEMPLIKSSLHIASKALVCALNELVVLRIPALHARYEFEICASPVGDLG